MNLLKFYLGLWSGKLASALLGKKDDRPGLLARKFDIDFMAHAAKPEQVLLVTGTNGKSSITNMINDMYLKLGKKTACNSQGMNTFAGQSLVMLKSNNIFNRPKVDIIVMEADELHADETFPQLEPTHLIISNLGRDSMYKNANPEIPYRSLQKALKQLADTVLFLNGDDPLSCFISETHKRIFYGVDDLGLKPRKSISDDFSICPKCGHQPVYKYRNYRHIGSFECLECGLKSPDKDYLCTDVTSDSIKVKEKDGSYVYPLISDTIYNIYNETAIIAYFREMGYEHETIRELLKDIHLPDIREEQLNINGIEVIRRAMKGQNASAAGSVLQSLVAEDGIKEVILMEDEMPDETTLETICWIWDTDFEYLKDDKIAKIIVSGRRHFDHNVRLLTAGIDKDKMVHFEDDEEIISHLETAGIDKIYILYDVEALSRSKNVLKAVKEYLENHS